jgi:hypothetical protein
VKEHPSRIQVNRGGTRGQTAEGPTLVAGAVRDEIERAVIETRQPPCCLDASGPKPSSY